MKFLNGLVVAFLVASIVFAISQSGNGGTQSTTEPTPPAVIDGGSGSGGLDEEEPPGAEAPPALRERADAFITALFLIKPDDTEATRRERVRPFGTAELVAGLDVGLGTDTEADRARIQQQLTVSGKAQMAFADFHPADDQGRSFDVTVPVTVNLSSPSNPRINSSEAYTAMRWELQDGRWLITRYEGR